MRVDLKRVVSGGQTGVDRAALDAAIDSDFACGGWCPKGRRSEDGFIPIQYSLKETASSNYPERTRLNILDSDGTLILNTGELTGGTKLTEQFAINAGKPFLILDLAENIVPETIINWIETNEISVLNVAGPRESTSPGIYQQSYSLLRILFDEIKAN